MKRNNTKSINKKEGTASNSKGSSSSSSKSFPLSLNGVIKIVVAVVVVAVSLSLWLRNKSVIKNLINADTAALKETIFGEEPHLFYCERGSSGTLENIPKIFQQYHDKKGTTLNFAAVNCSQTLPSGKNMWQRFKLKKDVRPAIFATAPWLAKPRQVEQGSLRDVKTLGTFVEKALTPKGAKIVSNEQLEKFCGHDKDFTDDVRSVGDTCFVWLKGKRHDKFHDDLEQKLILQHPRIKLAMVDARKKRLSFENPLSLPAEDFAMKLHAIRNGTHYLTMNTPPTWDYLSTFASHALQSPLYGFTGDNEDPVKLLTPKKPKSQKKKKDKKKIKKSKSSQLNDEQQQQSSSQQTESPEAAAQRQEQELQMMRERERLRREEMLRQESEHLFESVGDDEDAGKDGDDDEENEDDRSNSADNEDDEGSEEDEEEEDEDTIEL